MQRLGKRHWCLRSDDLTLLFQPSESVSGRLAARSESKGRVNLLPTLPAQSLKVPCTLLDYENALRGLPSTLSRGRETLLRSNLHAGSGYTTRQSLLVHPGRD